LGVPLYGGITVGSEYPLIAEVLKLVGKRSPLQAKKIRKSLNLQRIEFKNEFTRFLQDYGGFVKARGQSIEEVVDAYVKMCNNMLTSQIYFSRKGEYPIRSQSQAFETVYNSREEMESYMLGLALSQFLWPTHYAMFSFFKKMVQKRPDTTSYLEVGPGHGLFFKEALNSFLPTTTFTAVDISKTSLILTEEIVEFFNFGERKISFCNRDISAVTEFVSADFLTAGELLEHVDDPVTVLRQLSKMLTEDGSAFISTCVDCPTIDHVYHFRSIGHIRDMIVASGFKIVDDLILPVEDLPLELVEENNVTVNYCAHVARRC
jgi:SAM-dependent methyltransferase